MHCCPPPAVPDAASRPCIVARLARRALDGDSELLIGIEMTPRLRIREARTEDLPALEAVRYADAPAIHRDRLRDAAAGHLHYLVAELSGTVVGFGLLAVTRPINWPDQVTTQHFPLVLDLYVAEAHRGQGIGTSIVRHMEKLALGAGYDRLFLSVDPIDNAGARALYVQLGYVALNAQPYREHWQFTDSDGKVHKGCGWQIDMCKELQ